MVDSVQQNFCEKIVIPSDFICMFKMSFFFLAHPVCLLASTANAICKLYYMYAMSTVFTMPSYLI